MSFTRNILSSLIKWIEEGVSIDDHQTNKGRILIEIRKYMQENASDRDISQRCFLYQINKIISEKEKNLKFLPSDSNYNNIVSTMVKEGLINIIREDNIINDIIEISILNSYGCDSILEIGNKSNTNLKAYIEELLGYASLSGTSIEAEAIHEIARISFYSLNIGILEREYIAFIMSRIISKCPPHELFRAGKVIYGFSFLLRSLVFLGSTSFRDQFIDYLEIVRESLLRRMEIKREILLCSEDHNNSTFAVLEQLRFIIAVLEISILFDDPRFLNAGLKANDRIFPRIAKISISTNKTRKNIKNILIGLLYNKSINMQEEKYRAMLCQI